MKKIKKTFRYITVLLRNFTKFKATFNNFDLSFFVFHYIFVLGHIFGNELYKKKKKEESSYFIHLNSL